MMDIQALPKELIDFFLSCLDAKSKRMMRTTSRYWFAHIKLDEFKIYFANPKTVPDIVQHFAKYYENVAIGIRLDKIITSNMKKFPVDHFARLTNLTSLQFADYESISWIENASALTTLINLQSCPIAVTSTLMNLTSLKLGSSESDLPRHFTNLRELAVSKCTEYKRALSLVANPSRLTALTLAALDPEEDEHILADFSNLNKLNIYDMNSRCSIKYLKNLESLTITCGCIPPDLFHLTQLTYLAGTIMNPSRDIELISKLSNLKYLNLQASYSSEVDYSYVSALTALETFYPSSSQACKKELQSLNSHKLTQLYTNQTLDESIGRLSSLLELYLTESDWQNYNYESFTGLRNLTKLFLSTTKTYMECAILNQLQSLKWLRFGVHSMKEAPKDFTLKNLTNLEDLNFVCRASAKMYSDMTNLTRLTSLQINLPAEVLLQDITLLTNLPLRKLVFHKQFYFMEREGYYVQQVMAMCTNLRELEHLKVWKVSSEEAIESLSVLTNLTYLALNRTRRVEGIHLTKLTSLQKLHFISKKVRNKFCKRGDFLTEKLTRLMSQEFSSE